MRLSQLIRCSAAAAATFKNVERWSDNEDTVCEYTVQFAARAPSDAAMDQVVGWLRAQEQHLADNNKFVLQSEEEKLSEYIDVLAAAAALGLRPWWSNVAVNACTLVKKGATSPEDVIDAFLKLPENHMLTRRIIRELAWRFHKGCLPEAYNEELEAAMPNELWDAFIEEDRRLTAIAARKKQLAQA
jgi:hypothetical protein